MISKSQIKLITSLQQKKYRNQNGLFLAEGPKIIKDLLQSGEKIHSLYSVVDASEIVTSYESVTEKELQKITALKTANSMLAVFFIPEEKKIENSQLILALDSVRDPGNLGTIIRLCDWYGVSQLVCSLDTVDCYNPKVIQATMGSIARVSILYTDLKDFLQKSDVPSYAAVMDGVNVYASSLPHDVILVMGNEANGISKDISEEIKHHISIPNYSKNKAAESLNVAMATGILLSEFRRSTET